MHNLGTARGRQQAPAARGRGSQRHQRARAGSRPQPAAGQRGGRDQQLPWDAECGAQPSRWKGDQSPPTPPPPPPPPPKAKTRICGGGTRPPRVAVGALHGKPGARRHSHPHAAYMQWATPRGSSETAPARRRARAVAGGRANRGGAQGGWVVATHAPRSRRAPRAARAGRGCVTRRAGAGCVATPRVGVHTRTEARRTGKLPRPRPRATPPPVTQQTPLPDGPGEQKRGRPLRLVSPGGRVAAARPVWPHARAARPRAAAGGGGGLDVPPPPPVAVARVTAPPPPPRAVAAGRSRADRRAEAASHLDHWTGR